MPFLTPGSICLAPRWTFGLIPLCFCLPWRQGLLSWVSDYFCASVKLEQSRRKEQIVGGNATLPSGTGQSLAIICSGPPRFPWLLFLSSLSEKYHPHRHHHPAVFLGILLQLFVWIPLQFAFSNRCGFEYHLTLQDSYGNTAGSGDSKTLHVGSYGMTACMNFPPRV